MHFYKNGRKLFYLALVTLMLSLSNWVWFYQKAVNDDEKMFCSAKAIMHFEDTVMESVNATVHFKFDSNGIGSIMLEGYTDSKVGWLYLQRYVKFNYTSTKTSPSGRIYYVKNVVSSKSSIDESPDVVFDYFMREMFDSQDALLIKSDKINDEVVLLSSIDSPLFVCRLISNKK